MSKNYKKSNEDVKKEENSETSASRNQERKGAKGRRNKGERSSTARAGSKSLYFIDPTLEGELTSFSFNQFVGVPFSLNSHLDNDEFTIPSVLKIEFNPSIGFVPLEFARTKGINLAAYSLYTSLSSINAKTTNYAPSDIATLILGLGNAIAFKEYIQRIFGCVMQANVRNRDVPKLLISACNVNYDDLCKNLADYRIRFNTLLTVFAKIPFLANIPYFLKCEEMFKYIYADDTTKMAQLILPTPRNIWKVNEVGSEQGTTLEPIDVSNPTDMNVLLNQFQEVLYALLNSTTYNYIYSDILNYAGKMNAPLLAMSLMPDDYGVTVVYDELYLTTVHNMRNLETPIAASQIPTSVLSVIGTPSDGLRIVPDASSGCLWSNPVFSRSTGGWDSDIILDYPVDDVDANARIESLQFTGTMAFIAREGNYNYYAIPALPVWYPARAKVYDTNNVYAVNSFGNMDLAAIAALSKFTNAPYHYSLNTDGTQMTGIVGDMKFFTTVPREYALRFHDTAMLGLMTLR